MGIIYILRWLGFKCLEAGRAAEKVEETAVMDRRALHLRWPVVAGAAAVLAAFGYYFITAPFAFPMEGQMVYGWSDYRITLLAGASILAALLLTGTSGRPRLLRLTAAFCTLLAGSVFTLFVVFNFGTNGPDGVLPSLFSTGGATAAMNVLDAMRLSPINGLPIQALTWFGVTVASFYALRAPRGLAMAAVDAGQFACSILAIYALGVYLVIPQWSQRVITGLQYNTAFGGLTNDDLLVGATVTFFALLAFRIAAKQRLHVLPSARQDVREREQ